MELRRTKLFMARYYGLSVILAFGALSYAAVPFYKMVHDAEILSNGAWV